MLVHLSSSYSLPINVRWRPESKKRRVGRLLCSLSRMGTGEAGSRQRTEGNTRYTSGVVIFSLLNDHIHFQIETLRRYRYPNCLFYILSEVSQRVGNGDW